RTPLQRLTDQLPDRQLHENDSGFGPSVHSDFQTKWSDRDAKPRATHSVCTNSGRNSTRKGGTYVRSHESTTNSHTQDWPLIGGGIGKAYRSYRRCPGCSLGGVSGCNPAVLGRGWGLTIRGILRLGPESRYMVLGRL